MWKRVLGETRRVVRRCAVALVGGSVLLAGTAMLVLPGPAFVVIPLGLAVLGVEFAWARHWLATASERAQRVRAAALRFSRQR